MLWEKKNDFNYPIFETIGETKKKPDLLFIHRDNPLCCGVIEMKSAVNDNNMRGTHKIIGYYDDYAKGKIKYFYKNIEWKPKYFLVGSPYSIEGHLFPKETIDIHTKIDLIKQKIIPPTEYVLTGEHFRQLSKDWIGNKRDVPDYRNTKHLLGILLSTKLSNANSDNPKPSVFCWVAYINKKGNITSTHKYFYFEDFIKNY